MSLKPLKLFHATDFVASVLLPGENRSALHPAWLPAAMAAWVGLACNVALWRAVAQPAPGAWRLAAAMGLALASVAGVVLCVLGWRGLRKLVAVVLVLLAAGLATSAWLRPLPFDPGLLALPATALLPDAGILAQGRAQAVLALLALPPLAWMWRLRLRRLDAGEQWASNLKGLVFWVAVGAAAAALARA
jgi:lipid A ethanolaminephosphotransferase